MADDLTSFFKSKKSKKHGSGRGLGTVVQSPDELARRLERTVQQQQALDRENGVDVNEEDERGNTRPAYSQQLSTGSAGQTGAGRAGSVGERNEESEWLDVEEQADIDMAKLGIKEMDIQEESDEQGGGDDESLSSRKTWNMPGQQQEQQAEKPPKIPGAPGMDVDDRDESSDDSTTASTKKEASLLDAEANSAKQEKENDGETTTKKEAYVPPSKRFQQLKGPTGPTMKKPNIEDAAEFPSLEVSNKLEEELEKVKKKKMPHQSFKKAASPSTVSAVADRPPGSISRQENPPQKWQRAAAPERTRDATPPPPQQEQGATGGRYVPPHLRK